MASALEKRARFYWCWAITPSAGLRRGLTCCGSGLARDSSHSVYQINRVACIASKPAPTVRGGLQVQRMPQRTQRRFLHGFAQGRVRVDGAGDVFQAGAHFQ